MNLVKLASALDVDEERLEAYFKPDGDSTASSIFFHLCSSLQNSGMMHNSIRFNDRYSKVNREKIKQVLCDFDARECGKKYSDWNSIYVGMLKIGVKDNGTQKKTQTNWQKYCRGLFDGIQYLTVGGGEGEVKDLIAQNDIKNLPHATIRKIEEISRKVHGLGFALTCDWLKESGCTWLAKPDVHISKVVAYILNKDSAKLTDEEIMRFVFDWSLQVKMSNIDTEATAYKIDKMIWLLCTGSFYLDSKEIGRESVYKQIDLLR